MKVTSQIGFIVESLSKRRSRLIFGQKVLKKRMKNEGKKVKVVERGGDEAEFRCGYVAWIGGAKLPKNALKPEMAWEKPFCVFHPQKAKKKKENIWNIDEFNWAAKLKKQKSVAGKLQKWRHFSVTWKSIRLIANRMNVTAKKSMRIKRKHAIWSKNATLILNHQNSVFKDCPCFD
jgi:hypothetical protein